MQTTIVPRKVPYRGPVKVPTSTPSKVPASTDAESRKVRTFLNPLELAKTLSEAQALKVLCDVKVPPMIPGIKAMMPNMAMGYLGIQGRISRVNAIDVRLARMMHRYGLFLDTLRSDKVLEYASDVHKSGKRATASFSNGLEVTLGITPAVAIFKATDIVRFASIVERDKYSARVSLSTPVSEAIVKVLQGAVEDLKEAPDLYAPGYWTRHEVPVTKGVIVPAKGSKKKGSSNPAQKHTISISCDKGIVNVVFDGVKVSIDSSKPIPPTVINFPEVLEKESDSMR